jgi:hypothetical protein
LIATARGVFDVTPGAGAGRGLSNSQAEIRRKTNGNSIALPLKALGFAHSA